MVRKSSVSTSYTQQWEWIASPSHHCHPVRGTLPARPPSFARHEVWSWGRICERSSIQCDETSRCDSSQAAWLQRDDSPQFSPCRRCNQWHLRSRHQHMEGLLTIPCPASFTFPLAMMSRLYVKGFLENSNLCSIEAISLLCETSFGPQFP